MQVTLGRTIIITVCVGGHVACDSCVIVFSIVRGIMYVPDFARCVKFDFQIVLVVHSICDESKNCHVSSVWCLFIIVLTAACHLSQALCLEVGVFGVSWTHGDGPWYIGLPAL